MAGGFLVAFNRTRGRVIAGRVRVADTPWSRAVGLLGRSSMEAGEGLWIKPCPMIHTFFMRFAIDAVFLDKGLRVVGVREGLAPWRFSPWFHGAAGVLELAGGSLRGGALAGDELEMRGESHAG